MGSKEILAIHPAPWQTRQGPPGVLTVLDANGHVVELLTVLDFVHNVTAAIAAAKVAEKTTA